MWFPPVSAVLLVAFLTACATEAPTVPATSEDSRSEMTGSDRDAHGCISSAGYSWCMRTKQCERPWELARKHAFAQTEKAFHEYCDKASQ